MRKLIFILTIFFIFQTTLTANETTTKINITKEMRYYNNIEDCAGLALFLGTKQSENIEYQEVVFSLDYLEEIFKFSYNVIGHKMHEDYTSWGDIDFESWDKVKEIKNELENYSVSLEEFKTLNFFLINQCIPILLKDANDVLDDLSSFKQRSIRKLTDLSD